MEYYQVKYHKLFTKTHLTSDKLFTLCGKQFLKNIRSGTVEILKYKNTFEGCSCTICNKIYNIDNGLIKPEIKVMQEITNELRTKIFAAYMPCEIKDEHSNEVRKIIGISIDECKLQIDMEYDKVWWDVNNLSKLILTPLAQLTPFDREVIRTFPSMINEVDYLRGKGYDVGFGEIRSLIEGGIAISKN